MSPKETLSRPHLPQLDEALTVIAKKLKTADEITIKMMTEPAVSGFLLSRLLAHYSLPAAPIFLVLPDELTKLKVWQFMLAWLKTESQIKISEEAGQVILSGSGGRVGETPFYILARPSPVLLAACLEKRPVLILLAQQEINIRVPAPDLFQKSQLTVKSGDIMKKQNLLRWLEAADYERADSASAPGLITSRGGLLDIFPLGETRAVRIDWLDETVESIKTFTPGQTKTTAREAVKFIPARLDNLPAKTPLSAYLAKGKKINLEPFPAHPDVVVAFKLAEIEALKSQATKTAPTKKRGWRDFSFLKKLQNGDYVVHVDHGLARFAGIVEQTIDEHTAEYFELHYAAGDKLFVPVTMAEKIEKYLGAANPPLARLSGGAWQKAVARVRADTLAEARALLTVAARRALAVAPIIPRAAKIEKSLTASFAYEETADQEQTIASVYHDLAQTKPMDRLVCGDVGFGKTEVAIRAAAKAALSDRQTAVLSPTTILTQQHIDTFTERLRDLPITIRGLSRFAPAKEQTQTIALLARGRLDIVIGTHRLLSGDVKFKNLGLIIIDEEQRFGVNHKEMLKKMRQTAHILTLTATPIPRTLHFALSGVRDISLITTPPPGRLPIITHIEPHNQTKIKAVLEQEVKRGGQAYYLYNHVETMALKKTELQNLLPRVRFGVIHGQLPEAEVAAVMHDFDRGQIDVLVCSTIIENGLDLPNVNTLVVDNAVQFGLAQLHQIRGRIGRGLRQAYAYFFYKRQKLTGEAAKRLAALEEARELGAGFDLARRDMEIRGVGNVLGREQHGQATAVGLGMYLRLLEEAVEEIKSGEPAALLPDITVDLPLEARLPQFFEPNKERRIELYHQWALINDLDELTAVEQNLGKEGALPKALENLFYILRLKILGRAAGLTAIDTANSFATASEQNIVLVPKEPMPPAKFARLLNIAPHWHYATDELKIKRSDLGPDWTKKLEGCIKSLR